MRDHILDTAIRLFNLHGYQATGVDQLVAETGVAKTTLYRHFASKEDLIIAALLRCDERDRDAMRAFVEGRARDPVRRLLATFDFLELWFASETFHGCPFMNAAGEHGASESQVLGTAALHKRLVLAYLEELCHAASLSDPKRVAAEINLLHEGATAVAQVTRKSDPAVRAKSMATRLLVEESRHLQRNKNGPADNSAQKLALDERRARTETHSSGA
ncbi:TetR/AcrR family transcriptional regulator [Methylobacterium isbiliense]|uniref:TetR/AcrR family transcriptional regulator n=1 Tax=Methylobacterium isbiliense TaxID=315478 RepID=UPI001EE26C2E|nr:TetR/AcrR family transcriptional regulator [Methylobacterium isbiliense]MDN3627642.1 helix-turn-helix domain-containing protein [Methylobacterium isbiliense]